jgi:5,10-methylenetetrahydrofolate reductase
VDGRKIYMASPEYMAKYAARLIRKGVRFVGGCCGTTPEHIKRMADAVRALAPGSPAGLASSRPEPRRRRRSRCRSPSARAGAPSSPRGEFLTTVEIVPPRGRGPGAMLEGVRLLKEAGIDGVNVPDGPRAQSRMGVLATSLLIQQRVGIEPVVHYCCRDRNLLGMLSDLLGAQALGLRNLLLITGDPPKMGPYPDATAVFDIDAIGLTNLVSRLNRGLDPGGSSIGEPTSFVIGVGVNPGAADLEHELRRFYWKVEAGAEYAITQPVFDVAQLFASSSGSSARGSASPSSPASGRWSAPATPSSSPTRCPAWSCRRRSWSGCARAARGARRTRSEEGIRIAQEMLARAARDPGGAGQRALRQGAARAAQSGHRPNDPPHPLQGDAVPNPEPMSPTATRMEKRVESLLVWGLYGALTAGAIALVLALVAVVGGRWEASTIALLAAAVAFGSIARALLQR